MRSWCTCTYKVLKPAVPYENVSPGFTGYSASPFLSSRSKPECAYMMNGRSRHWSGPLCMAPRDLGCDRAGALLHPRLEAASRPRCRPNHPPRLSWRRRTRRPTHLQGGFLRRLLNTRKPVIFINKLPTASNLTNSSGRQAMHSQERPSAEKNARKRTKLRTPGGTLPRHTSEGILTVNPLLTRPRKV